jgi:integrase
MTGARKSELLELHSRDVAFTGDGVAVLTLHDTKNGSTHHLRLGLWLSTQWREWMRDRPDGMVFAGQAQRLRKHVEWMQDSMGADGVTLHDLRRSFASFAHDAGIDMTTLKALMNHAPAAGDVTTRHYLRISPDAMAKAWQQIEQFLLSKVGESE